MIRSCLGTLPRLVGAAALFPLVLCSLSCQADAPLRATVATLDERPGERLRHGSLDVPLLSLQPPDGESWRFDESRQSIDVPVPPLDETPEAVVLHFEPAAAREIDVSWTVGGLRFEENQYSKSIKMRRRDQPTDRTVMLTKASWSSAIDQLSIAIESHPGEWTGLQRIDLTAPFRTARQLGPRAETVWRVGAGGEIRRALPALWDRPLEWTTGALPDDARLHVGLTHTHSSTESVDFHVWAGDLLLAHYRMPPFEPKTDERWHDLDIDLAPFVGQSLDLRFEIAQNDGPVSGESFWSVPRLSARNPDPPALRGIVVLSLDRLELDRLSLFGADRRTTPWLDRWASSSDVARFAVTGQAREPRDMAREWLGGRSTGREESLGESQGTLLSSRLQALGYRTFALVDGGLFEPWMGFDVGFDRFRRWPDMPNDLARTIDHAIAWIDELAEEPFFLLLHSDELRRLDAPAQPFFRRLSPLQPPPAEEFSEAPDGEILWRGASLPDHLAALPDDLYDARLARADFSIHRLLEALESRGLSEDTLLVITSGIATLEGGSDTVDPLLVRFPGRATGFRTDTLDALPVVDRRDLLPTLLDAVGVADPDRDLEGRSLLASWRSGELLSGTIARLPTKDSP